MYPCCLETIVDCDDGLPRSQVIPPRPALEVVVHCPCLLLRGPDRARHGCFLVALARLPQKSLNRFNRGVAQREKQIPWKAELNILERLDLLVRVEGVAIR